MYALIIDGQIDKTRPSLPRSARRLDTGEWVTAGEYWTPDLAEACGWFVVPDPAPKPPDDPGMVWELGPVTLDGNDLPVARQWTQRPMTQDELDAVADSMERSTVRGLLPRLTALVNTSGTLTRARMSDELRFMAVALRRIIRDTMEE